MLYNIINFKVRTSSLNFITQHLGLVLFFGLVYYICNHYTDNAFKIPKSDSETELSLLDCFYFSLITQTTVGYGDIIPTNKISKIINIVQLLTIYGVFMFII